MLALQGADQVACGETAGPKLLAVDPHADVSVALAEDLGAGRIATGRASIEELGWELFHYYLDVASGRRKTWAERHRLHNDLVLFNPAPIT